MNSSNIQRSSLFQKATVMFSALAFLLLAAFKGVSLLFPLWQPAVHKDGRAILAMKTLELSLQPAALVGQGFSGARDLADATGCRDEAQSIFSSIVLLEKHLQGMAGLSEDSPARGNARLTERLLLDAPLWTQAVRAQLNAGVFSCADLGRGFAMMTKNDGSAIDAFAWRGTTFNPLPDGQWLQIPEQVFSRPNPWAGLPGCVLINARETSESWYLGTSKNQHCAGAGLAGSANPRLPSAGNDIQKGGGFVPDSIDSMLADMSPLLQPASSVYRELTLPDRHGPNTLTLNGHEREVGFNAQLTIDPAAQSIAQQAAQCYAGRGAACAALGLTSAQIKQISATFYEQAAVRMAGIAIIDVATGRIDALASAHTRCFQQQYDGPGRDADCPNLSRTPSYKPDMLLNHAIFTDVMPASTVKPILALGFLQTPGYAVNDAELTRQLKVSDSVGFLNRLYCLDTKAKASDCNRMLHAQKAASQLGWNADCAKGGKDCGFTDSMFGRNASDRMGSALGAVRPLGLHSMMGRLYTAPSVEGNLSSLGLMSNAALAFNTEDAKKCSTQGWELCSGNKVANTVAEGFGQGSARATPLAVAAMMARLESAGQGQNALRRPYLIEGLTDATGKSLAIGGAKAAQPFQVEIAAESARRVVNAMRQGHKSAKGTAHLACKAAAIGDCDHIDWIAGKTGTPPFAHDTITLEKITAKCEKAQPAITKDQLKTLRQCKQQIPYKWYTALYRSKPSAQQFDKAIAVLTERNWHETGPLQGKVDAPGDNGPNRSAEIALRIMAVQRSNGVTTALKPSKVAP